jgi:iron complex transport system substrate-binding protein
MKRFLMHAVCAAGVLCASAPQAALITRTDDAGKTITLAAPAQRIISLAPHVTELLYAAGAGDKIVGTVDYSDYPEAAKKIPRVGDNKALDLERIVALKPDVIIVWRHGNAQRQLESLMGLGIPVYYNEPKRLTDIPLAIETFGVMAGTEATAQAAAGAFRAQLETLRRRYSERPPVKLFYQVWSRPLMTLTGKHLVADAFRLCGGVNPFAELESLAAPVSTEAVVAADPEVVISTSMGKNGPDGLEMWSKWPRMTAVARGNLFVLDGNLINRHGPRILQGTEKICEQLDAARAKRPAAGAKPQ